MASGHGRRRSERIGSLSKCEVKLVPEERLGKRDQDDTSDDPIELPRLTKITKKQKTKRKDKEASSDVAKKEHQRMDGTNELHDDKKLKLSEEDDAKSSDTDSPDSPEWSSRGKAKNTAPKAKVKKASGMASKNAPTKPKKRKTKFEKINDQLEALGVRNSDGGGNCARAAIYRGFIKLTGKPSDLDQVIVSDTMMCGHKCDAKLGDLLRQPDYGGDDYEDGLQFATVICEECAPDSDDDEAMWEDTGEGRTYVTGICQGNPRFDSGKFHNHCTDCKLFGKCIGDYREMHCNGCGGHYFGSGGRFPCPRCGGRWQTGWW